MTIRTTVLLVHAGIMYKVYCRIRPIWILMASTDVARFTMPQKYNESVFIVSIYFRVGLQLGKNLVESHAPST